MKRFLKNLFIFLAVVLTINLLLNLVVPTSVQDERFAYRYDYLKKNINSYNTIFFGTSRTLRHIIPSEFDSINQTFGIATKSFNLGAPASKAFETYFQYECFLKDYSALKDRPVKNVYIELQGLAPLEASNIYADKSSYWLSLRYTKSIFQYLLHSNKSAKQKLSYGYYFIGFLKNYLGFGFINPKMQEDVDSGIWLGKNSDGYIDYDEEIRTGINMEQKQKLIDFKREFAKDTMSLVKKREGVRKEFSTENPKPEKANPEHLKIVKNLIKLSGLQGINLKFIVQPRLSSYSEMEAIRKEIPDNVIVIVDPNKYEGLWSVANSFNSSHLNYNGSRIFTKSLCEEILKLPAKDNK